MTTIAIVFRPNRAIADLIDLALWHERAGRPAAEFHHQDFASSRVLKRKMSIYVRWTEAVPTAVGVNADSILLFGQFLRVSAASWLSWVVFIKS